MRQILIIALAYGVTPILMAATIWLAWWLAKRAEQKQDKETR
ncbi:MAG: hypothetical protein ACREJ4_09130 [Candidatus Methylomirabilaceae bacterium]